MVTAIGRPVQIAYVVEDAREAARSLAHRVGAGPFFVRRNNHIVDVVLNGRAAEFDHTSAYGQWGEWMVEFVEDHTVGPSITDGFRAFPDVGVPLNTASTDPARVASPSHPSLPRFHHVACIVDDWKSTLEAQRKQLIMTARSSQTEFAFLDYRDTLGHFVEMYPSTPRLLGFYETVASAATNWLGDNPVREI